MTRTKYSDEFKEQVVREILEKERTIASVAASYDLVPQTVGVWVAKRRRRDAEAQDPEAAAESAEIARLKAENRELRAEMRVLEKNGCLLRERTSVSERYELIRREEGNCPVASMCKLVGVSKSGYYDWLGRPDSATKVRRRKLTLMVESEFNASDMTYGYRRVTAALHRKGVTVSADTVRSIMREKELRAAQPRRKTRTTVPADDIDTRPDLVGRDFTARAPGLKWVGDITYIRTWVGFVYLATVLDCCTKKVIGYAMADNMRTDLVCEAIDMAVRRCPHQKNVTIFHSDRGSQYTSQQFARHLEHHRIRPSVGRTGVCWDNAWAESFNATLKNERVHRMVYPTREKAINDVASWIELTYNHTRLHSTLGYRTPNEVEHELRSQKHAA